MSEKSTIEWTDATWNPVTGCTKVSPGCKNCYAERVFKRVYPNRPFRQVQLHRDRLIHPIEWRRPRRIFVNSLSDLFHEDIPIGFKREVFITMETANWHTYQILTKRPERMSQCIQAFYPNGDVPKHIWLGVSVEDQKTADERIPLLLQTPSAVQFVSYEPALGPLSLSGYLDSPDAKRSMKGLAGPYLDWVITGGESGPGARPSHPDWFRAVRDQCQAARVPFFFKQWGEWMPLLESRAIYENRPVAKVVPGDIAPRTAQWTHMIRLGRKRAGRLLDYREWNEYPELTK
jgi:protein gp37